MFKQTFKLFCLGAALAITPSCTEEGEVNIHPAHWDYESTDWASTGYVDCDGVVQAPINVDTESTIMADLGELNFNYSPFDISIQDNGHTVQVNAPEGSANTLEVDGVTFQLLQFHYHTHSEHAVDGNYYDMEIHLVHQDLTTGNLAVVGVFLEGDGTSPNDFVQKFADNIPDEEMGAVSTATPINVSDLLPADHKYYTYTGSLTTPPCSQGLKWMLLKEPVSISESQLQTFEQVHEVNARPLQPLNNRTVLEKR